MFAGISIGDKRYSNSIERFNKDYTSDSPSKWELIETQQSFAVRQGQCSHQLNNDEIAIFGGFGGEFLSDVYTFKHSEKVMKREENDAPQLIFTYQMPTLFDEVKKHILCVDWKTKKTLVFSSDKQWQALRELV